VSPLESPDCEFGRIIVIDAAACSATSCHVPPNRKLLTVYSGVPDAPTTSPLAIMREWRSRSSARACRLNISNTRLQRSTPLQRGPSREISTETSFGRPSRFAGECGRIRITITARYKQCFQRCTIPATDHAKPFHLRSPHGRHTSTTSRSASPGVMPSGKPTFRSQHIFVEGRRQIESIDRLG